MLGLFVQRPGGLPFAIARALAHADRARRCCRRPRPTAGGRWWAPARSRASGSPRTSGRSRFHRIAIPSAPATMDATKMATFAASKSAAVSACPAMNNDMPYDPGVRERKDRQHDIARPRFDAPQHLARRRFDAVVDGIEARSAGSDGSHHGLGLRVHIETHPAAGSR